MLYDLGGQIMVQSFCDIGTLTEVSTSYNSHNGYWEVIYKVEFESGEVQTFTEQELNEDPLCISYDILQETVLFGLIKDINNKCKKLLFEGYKIQLVLSPDLFYFIENGNKNSLLNNIKYIQGRHLQKINFQIILEFGD